jgi:hypothetical protein
MLEKRDVLEQRAPLAQKKLIVSHAPFYHSGQRVTERSYHIMLAALPALLMGFYHYGMPAFSVVCLSISTAIIWELFINLVTKRSITIGDGNAAVLGLLFGMLVPATMPWWAVITGTFLVIVIGKQIFGGIGSNAFHPVALAIAMMLLSWGNLFDFDVNRSSNGPAARRHRIHLRSGAFDRRDLPYAEGIYPLGDSAHVSGRHIFRRIFV